MEIDNIVNIVAFCKIDIKIFYQSILILFRCIIEIDLKFVR